MWRRKEGQKNEWIYYVREGESDERIGTVDLEAEWLRWPRDCTKSRIKGEGKGGGEGFSIYERKKSAALIRESWSWNSLTAVFVAWREK